MTKGLLIMACAFALLAARCHQSDGCAASSTRCEGNAAEICDSNGNWQLFADCDQISENSGDRFVCSSITEGGEGASGHTCVLEQGSGGSGGAQ